MASPRLSLRLSRTTHNRFGLRQLTSTSIRAGLSSRSPRPSHALSSLPPSSSLSSTSIIPPLRSSRFRPFSTSPRSFDDLPPPDDLDEGERKVFTLLQEGLQPSKLKVQDISGGCGSMYGIDVVAEQFKGLSVIKQHRLVNQVLGDEIKKWHGVQLKTKAPET